MKRNYGIDALRILSMFMVVVLHVLGQGGMLSGSEPGSLKYWTLWFLEIACFCATDCFALISGYVMYKSKPRLSRAVSLWLQVAFYTIPALIVFALVMPDSIGLGAILDAVFPVGRRHYWYISSYFGLLLMMPLLNTMIEHTPKRVMCTVLIAMTMTCSVIPRLLMTDPYTLGGGYSLIWLMLLYLGGACIHKYNVADKVGKISAWMMALIPILVTFLAKFAFEVFPQSIYPTAQYSGIFVSYTSPTVVLTAVGLLIALSKQRFKKLPARLISLCAPAALGVYLIHTNLLVWEHLLKGFSRWFLDQNWFVMLFLVFGAAVLIYVVCTLVEIVRILLFELIRVDTLCRKLDDLVEKLFNKHIKV